MSSAATAGVPIVSSAATAVPSVIPGHVVQAARFNDAPFAIAFLMAAAGMLVVALWPVTLPASYATSIEDLRNTTKADLRSVNTTIHISGADMEYGDAIDLLYDVATNMFVNHGSIIGFSVVVSMITTGLLGSGWLLLMRTCGPGLVTLALVLPPFFWTAIALYFLTEGSPVPAGVALLMVMISLCVLRGLWAKIPVTAKALSLASQAILAMPATSAISALASVFVMVWWGLFVNALVVAHVLISSAFPPGSEQEPNETGSLLLNLAYIALTLALYWGMQVFLNVSYVCTCGAVTKWYYEPLEAESGACCFKPVVAHAFCRAVGWSFGSICLGSLLVAIVQLIGLLLQSVEKKAREGNLVFVLMVCCVRCLLSLIESLLEMFNQWAFVYVAMYSASFATSGRAVFRLLKTHGLTAIFSGIVSDSVLNWGSILSCLGGTAAGTATAHLLWPAGAFEVDAGGVWNGVISPAMGVYVVGLPSFFLSALVARCTLQPVSAAIRTVLVAFAEAPNLMRARDPMLHDELIKMQEAATDPDVAPIATPVGVPVVTNKKELV